MVATTPAICSWIYRDMKNNNSLTYFREQLDGYYERTAKDPSKAEVSMELYDKLLTVNYGVKENPKLLGYLFGVKIMIDPMLQKDDVVFRA